MPGTAPAIIHGSARRSSVWCSRQRGHRPDRPGHQHQGDRQGLGDHEGDERGGEQVEPETDGALHERADQHHRQRHDDRACPHVHRRRVGGCARGLAWLAVSLRELSIPGLFLVERPTHRDERGFFREVVRWDELEAAIGRAFRPVQWNHSLSEPRVLRALHAEAWNKLIYPVTGTMFAAVVDIRPEEPTFGRTAQVTLDAADPDVLFIPSGLANSICVVGDEPVHYLYLVDAYYDGSDTRAVAWDDADLGIDWPVAAPVLSARDRANPTMRELFPDRYRD